MRITTLLTAIVLLCAVGSTTVAADAGEDPRERNRAYLLEEIDRELPEGATATLATGAGAETVPAREAIGALLDHLDAVGVDLADRLEASGAPAIATAAGQESFPLAGTGGLVVEHDSGGGLLQPGQTCERVKVHEVATNTLSTLDPVFTEPQDGFVTSTLSEAVEFTHASMGEGTGTLNDTVSGYEGAILAGPNHDTTCAAFQYCSWGDCFHAITHVTTLSTGFVTDGEAAQLVHEQAPLP